MSTAARAAPVDLARLDRVIEEQQEIFLARQTKSLALLERARAVLAGGVTSTWQIADPQTIWIDHGEGSTIVDADGNDYVDLHGGYGVMLVGHSHPKIVEAVRRQIARGSHFAQPMPDAIEVAEDLARRFGLPLWRFGNSGTESTMDAVHLMRAATGRDKIVKIEGTYHGHHDSVQVSVYQEEPEIGPARFPVGAPAAAGIPRAIIELTLVAPFNNPQTLRRIFEDNAGEIAGMIIEPVMMNAGIIPPENGFLQEARAVTREHGALLAFDEVKTGLTISPGGATALFGVAPDLVCLAKAMGGGLPCGAIGGTEEVMELIVDGTYEQVGTFNGNPLTMATARTALTEILTPDAYEHFDKLRTSMQQGCEDVIAEWDIPAYVVALGAKGCITFSDRPVRNYRDFLDIDDRFSHGHWLFQHNNGVFLPPWSKAEQWLVSVQHSDADVDLFLDNFAQFAKALRS